MAKQSEDRADRLYVNKISVRISDKELDILERKSIETGIPVSTVARQMMFEKETQKSVAELSGDERYKEILAVQQCRAAFKKIASRITDAVGVYDKSLDLVDENGKRIVSTEQTIRHVSGLTEKLMVLQKNLNIVTDAMGLQPVLYAARPSRDSRLGRMFEADRQSQQKEEQEAMLREEEETRKNAENYASAGTDQNGKRQIPKQYRFMFKSFLTGRLVDDAVQFTSKKGMNMMKFRVATETNVFGKPNTHYIDVIKEKNGIFEYLKKGVSVSISGDLDIERVEKDNQVYISKSIYADSVTIP